MTGPRVPLDEDTTEATSQGRKVAPATNSRAAPGRDGGHSGGPMGSSRHGDHGHDHDDGSFGDYNPPSHKEQASRSCRPARLQQQSVSPLQQPDTPSPIPQDNRNGLGDFYGSEVRGYGGGDGCDTSTHLPPDMADMFIPEGADAPPPTNLIQCELCSRKFVPKALAIHSRICAKVFVSKRKQFNSKSARAEGTDIAQSERVQGCCGGRVGLRGGAAHGARQPLKQQRAASATVVVAEELARGAAGKLPKWKRQSEIFRAGLRAARPGAKGGGSGGGDYCAPAPYDDDLVPCPHCQRHYSEKAAERHIPQCQNIKAKPARLVRGGGRGAHVHTLAPVPVRVQPFKENSAPAYPRKGAAAPHRTARR